MSVLPLYTVDSFTNKPFTGNPAAVCLDSEGLADEIKQNIAAEMNISETAFVRLLNSKDSFEKSNRFGLRWFTPTMEVPLCGHATLATSAVLFKCIGNVNEKIYFETLSGTLSAVKEGDKIGLDLPLNTAEPIDRSGLEQLLSFIPSPVTDVYCTKDKGAHLLLRLPDSTSRAELEKLTPEISRFTEVDQELVAGVIVTLKASKENGGVDDQGITYDFISRYFAPWVGIPEDPVTGAAHTVLAGYWSKVLGKNQLYARQCSARGGDLNLNIRDDGRLDVIGNATVVLQGKLHL